MTTLQVALLQMDLVWENQDQNLQNILELVVSLKPSTQLVLLPEMFLSGFSMQPDKIAVPMTSESIKTLQELARKKDVAIAGSLAISEKGKYYNRFVFIHPTGKLESYDKRHLFTLAGEERVFKSGNLQQIVSYKGFSIALFVCYDLRFPVWSRNTQNYDVMLYVANWPASRVHAWDSLLRARAIENLSYVLAVNRTGTDANQLEYPGHSQAIDYEGHFILEPQPNAGVYYVQLELESQLAFRKKMGFLNDQDLFTLEV